MISFLLNFSKPANVKTRIFKTCITITQFGVNAEYHRCQTNRFFCPSKTLFRRTFQYSHYIDL